MVNCTGCTYAVGTTFTCRDDLSSIFCSQQCVLLTLQKSISSQNSMALIQTNMHLVVADDQMQQHTFQWILKDFQPEREGFDKMIQWMREGKDIDAASDGSRLNNGRAPVGWIMWAICGNLDEDRQLTKRPKILVGGTMRVGGRLDANTAFRAEALGCLIIPIIVCLVNEFIHQHQRLRVRHTYNNQGLVDQLRWMYKQERYHTIPDTADNDLTVPTSHWAKKNDSRLIWQQGHTQRREKDLNK